MNSKLWSTDMFGKPAFRIGTWRDMDMSRCVSCPSCGFLKKNNNNKYGSDNLYPKMSNPEFLNRHTLLSPDWSSLPNTSSTHQWFCRPSLTGLPFLLMSIILLPVGISFSPVGISFSFCVLLILVIKINLPPLFFFLLLSTGAVQFSIGLSGVWKLEGLKTISVKLQILHLRPLVFLFLSLP